MTLVLPKLAPTLPDVEFDAIGLGNSPRVEWVVNDFNGGGTYDPEGWGYPWRIVLHTIQGSADPNTIRTHRAPPQLWYNPATRRMWQTILLSRSGFAMWQGVGHYTNKARAIQVELHGYSEETAGWPQEWLDNITYDVIVPICRWIARYTGASIDLTQAPPPGAIGGSAAEDAPQRMSEQQWAIFNGLCSHRHVPQNGDRWDTGELDTPRIAEHARLVIAGLIANDPGPLEDDDMTLLVQVQAPGDPLHESMWAVNGVFKRPIRTFEEVELMWSVGLAKKVGDNGWLTWTVAQLQPYATVDEWTLAGMPQAVATSVNQRIDALSRRIDQFAAEITPVDGELGEVVGEPLTAADVARELIAQLGGRVNPPEPPVPLVSTPFLHRREDPPRPLTSSPHRPFTLS